MMEQRDLETLVGMHEFRSFLFEAIQLAGICEPANGHDPRDLAWFEGRRSLGLELLQLADAGQPTALRTPNALATLNAVLMTALNSPSKPLEKKHARNRHDEIED